MLDEEYATSLAAEVLASFVNHNIRCPMGIRDCT